MPFISLNIVNKLVFVMYRECVLCDAGPGFIYVI